MKLSQIVSDFQVAFQHAKSNPTGENRIIYGYLSQPGVGKTAKVKAAAAKCGARVVELVGSLLSPTDICAYMPSTVEGVHGNKVNVLSPFFTQDLPWADLVNGEKIVLFLDEITNTHPEVLKTTQKLINEHGLNGRKLGENVIVVAAGNRTSDRSASSNLSTAVYNRITWREWVYDNDELITYLSSRYNAPEMIAYLALKPLLEKDFTDALNLMGRGSYTQWASPRSFEKVLQRLTTVNETEKEYAIGAGESFASSLMTMVGKDVKEVKSTFKPKKCLSISDMAGDLGQGRATEVYAFCELVESMPNIADILNDPENVEIPKEIDKRYAIVSLMAGNADKENFDAASKYITRMDVSMQVLFIKMMMIHGTLMFGNPVFTERFIHNKKFMDAIQGA